MEFVLKLLSTAYRILADSDSELSPTVTVTSLTRSGSHGLLNIYIHWQSSILVRHHYTASASDTQADSKSPGASLDPSRDDSDSA